MRVSASTASLTAERSDKQTLGVARPSLLNLYHCYTKLRTQVAQSDFLQHHSLLQNPVPLNHQTKKHGPITQFVWTTMSILLKQIGVASGTHFVLTAGNHFLKNDS